MNLVSVLPTLQDMTFGLDRRLHSATPYIGGGLRSMSAVLVLFVFCITSINIETEKQTDKAINRKPTKQAQLDIHTDKLTGRETDKKIDKQTDMHINKQKES